MSNLGHQPTSSHGPVPARTGRTPVLPIISFVLSAIAIFFFPIVFGVAAIVLAAIALSRRERFAKLALGVAIAATVLGFVLGALAATTAIQG
jgi:hypothetical protein